MTVDPNSLFDEILGNSRSKTKESIHPETIKKRLENLRDWSRGRPHFERERDGVTCAGDPILIDSRGKTHHYWGHAVMIVFNGSGVLTALEYVGCTGDRNYIREVWRHEVATNKYKYMYLGEAPNKKEKICAGSFQIDDPHYNVGDETWASEKYADEVPDKAFFDHFTGASRTFFVNSVTGTFMQGPDFGAIKQILENPVTVSKTIIGHMQEKPQEWMVQAVQMITERSGYHHSDHGKYHTSDNPKASDSISKTIMKVQLAQFACGLTVSVMG